MKTHIRRLVLIVATSSGIITATTLAAHAGLNFSNHCEPRHGQGSRGDRMLL
jgi:hypothetical protein